MTRNRTLTLRSLSIACLIAASQACGPIPAPAQPAKPTSPPATSTGTLLKPAIPFGPAPSPFDEALTVRGTDGSLPPGTTATFTPDDGSGRIPGRVVDGRLAFRFAAGVQIGWGGTLAVDAPTYAAWGGRGSTNASGELCPCDPYTGGQVNEVILQPAVAPLPPPPTRQQLLTMQTAMYGLTCPDVPTFGGSVHWWDPGIQAIPTLAERQKVYACKHGRGDTGIIIGPGLYASILYDEGGNPYQVAIPTFDVAARVAEHARNGFLTDLYMDGDAMGWQVAMDEFPIVYKALLQGGPPQGPQDLNRYVNYRPAWDGWFYGIPESQIMAWGHMARTTCTYCVITFEFNTGHIPFGEGGNDYLPGGRMQDFDGVKVEFSVDTVHDDNTWQILARLIGPAYNHPADDPNGGAPWYMAPPTPRGPWGVECFEPPTYLWVRPDRSPSQAQADSDRQYFVVIGCPATD